ncbi:MAG: DUF2075 domain-containing protein [Puniceicoccales bacterium]|jgi:hypothetical protein|nr:DUF2075 domain-containing protein [Puniceicoccales bacterium]
MPTERTLETRVPLDVTHRAWYRADKIAFLSTTSEKIIGELAINSCRDGFDTTPAQTNAWLEEIGILQNIIPETLPCRIFLEFNIPRMGRRIDALLLFKLANVPHIVIIEFKVGEKRFKQSDIDQVWDYALDLKNFHKGSHSAVVIPICIATKTERRAVDLKFSSDNIARPLFLGIKGTRTFLNQLSNGNGNLTSMGNEWENTAYCPTPTIIEAARSLYSQHSVMEITRNDAGAKNITSTSACVKTIIEGAARKKQKTICFVTGVPGAGKTLVGLNIATLKHEKRSQTHAVYLSGNGPLVSVLNEALVRDEIARMAQRGERKRKGDVATEVKSFIQNVHHFRDEAIRNTAAPSEHVVIFDEAQRAWNLQMTRNFMQRKKKILGFNQSEPEFLISYMDRHLDWAVIVCLVGGGQEINTGEAGIGAWIEAATIKFPHWKICLSDKITDDEYASGNTVEKAKNCANRTTFYPQLHLDVSMRSFRSEKVSAFVKALLDLDIIRGRELFGKLSKYPIVITRNLHLAKDWLRTKARGSERIGLLASSKALRLKPYAIDVGMGADPVHYFLEGKDDPRSSFYLESVATEFQIQGLELDWTCVAWDGDLRISENNSWSYHNFRGNKWENIHHKQNRDYLKNAYRVLLTRARQGMVIFVPHGNNPPDATRDQKYFDNTYEYLRSIGIPEILPLPAIEDKGY